MPWRRDRARAARSSGRRTGASTSSRPTRSAARSTTSRSRSTATGGSSPCATTSSTTRGAYTPYGIVVPIITATPAPGPYRLRNYAVEFEVAYTNKVAGHARTAAPAARTARFVMERMIGLIARELGLEPAEVRRRNFIQPDEFPWDVGLTFQDGGADALRQRQLPGRARDGARDASALRDVPRAAGRGARRQGRYLGLGIGVLRRGHGHRPVRGRARARRAERQGAGRHRPDHPGPGPRHDLRPDRRRGARLRSRRRHRRHRRHHAGSTGAPARTRAAPW